jgi:ATP-dependent protease ClpP protease subunit
MLAGPSVPNQPAPRFWNVERKTDDHGEITIYGEIVSHHPTNWLTGEAEDVLLTSPEGFLRDLEAVKDAATVTVRINSVGGDVYTALGIANRLKELSGTTTAVIDGIAASAATVVAMGCDSIQAYGGSIFMIHEALTELYGAYNHKSLMQVNKMLEAANKAVAEQYHAKTGMEVDKIRGQMATEKWMTGREALDEGWIDEVLDGDDPSMSITNDGTTLTVNGIRMSAKAFEHVPDRIPVIKASAPSPVDPGTEPHSPTPPIQNKEEKTMTIEELRAQSPELVEQIAAQARQEATSSAIADERARLQSISEIASAIGDPQLVNDAMYGDHACTAAELALRAAQQAAQLGQSYLASSQSDYQASGAADVTGAPNAGNPEPPESTPKEMTEAEAIAMIVGNAAGQKKGGLSDESK